jgi:rRNA maturation endonuclease Nob1
MKRPTPCFLYPGANIDDVVTMGVIDRAKEFSGLDSSDDGQARYVCLACETTFEIQYHSCPACGSFDVRCAKWTGE